MLRSRARSFPEGVPLCALLRLGLVNGIKFMNIRCATSRDSSHRSHIVLCLLLLVGAVLASQAAPAQGRPHGHDGRHVDNRWGHNRPYYPHGHSVPHIPHGAYEIHHGGHAYWYHGGQWYQRHGGVSIIVGGPIGAFVPVLPPYYSTVWWRGIPYYYADSSYYIWDNRVRRYEVVAEPEGIEVGGKPVPAAEQIFIYPQRGQSPQQQETDRYECHRFAVDQTHYDPTLPAGGVAADRIASKRADYLRAQSACLDGRGYSVK